MWGTQVGCETTIWYFFKTWMVWDRWPILHSSAKEVHIDFMQFSQWPKVTDPDPGSFLPILSYLSTCKTKKSLWAPFIWPGSCDLDPEMQESSWKILHFFCFYVYIHICLEFYALEVLDYDISQLVVHVVTALNILDWRQNHYIFQDQKMFRPVLSWYDLVSLSQVLLLS